VTFTPTSGITDSSNVISLNSGGIVDLAGNLNVGTTDSNNYAVDTLRPTATIVLSDSALKAGETAQVTITFSEAVSGFTDADLTVANGSLSGLSSSDGGVTWTATFTPDLGVVDLTNLISLNNSGINDMAGNTGTGVTESANYSVETRVPTATIVVADDVLQEGEVSLVTITFSEAVSGFDNADLSVSNGTLSNVSSSDGGVTWTATLTPASNVSGTSNLISLDTRGVVNILGNSGVGVVSSNTYAIDTLIPNDVKPPPEFLVQDPVAVVPPAEVPLQPIVFTPPTGDLGSPLGFPPLFEQRDTGGLRPVGDIFISRGALAPSFIAQVFSDAAGDGSAQGFLGFGGGDGGVFGSSTLSGLFNQDSASDSESLNAFGSRSIQDGDLSQGLRGMFGAPTLGQQLQELKDIEQRQIDSLAIALQQVGISQVQA